MLALPVSGCWILRTATSSGLYFLVKMCNSAAFSHLDFKRTKKN